MLGPYRTPLPPPPPPRCPKCKTLLVLLPLDGIPRTMIDAAPSLLLNCPGCFLPLYHATPADCRRWGLLLERT